jgi:hypothetical protein
MPLRVPVLGEDDVGKSPGETVANGHDLVAVGNGEGTSRAEVVLDVDQDQGVGGRGAGHEAL